MSSSRDRLLQFLPKPAVRPIVSTRRRDAALHSSLAPASVKIRTPAACVSIESGRRRLSGKTLQNSTFRGPLERVDESIASDHAVNGTCRSGGWMPQSGLPPPLSAVVDARSRHSFDHFSQWFALRIEHPDSHIKLPHAGRDRQHRGGVDHHLHHWRSSHT